jgi:rubrerythrin
MTGRVRIESLEASGYVEFFTSGQQVIGEFRCSDCGYGVSVNRHELPQCPMCGGSSWEQSPWSPFTRSQ